MVLQLLVCMERLLLRCTRACRHAQATLVLLTCAAGRPVCRQGRAAGVHDQPALADAHSVLLPEVEP